jgi:hypothetical protein
MQKTKFYVDFCFEAGSDDYSANVSGRYQFGIELTDNEFEELYQTWFDNNCDLNNWASNWDKHDKLYNIINEKATHALFMHLKEEISIVKEPLDVYWQLSRETAESF